MLGVGGHKQASDRLRQLFLCELPGHHQPQLPIPTKKARLGPPGSLPVPLINTARPVVTPAAVPSQLPRDGVGRSAQPGRDSGRTDDGTEGGTGCTCALAIEHIAG